MDKDIIKQGRLLIAVGGCPAESVRTQASGCKQCIYKNKFTAPWIEDLTPLGMYDCEREVMSILTTRGKGE